MLPGVRATKDQRRVLTRYLDNGGDKTEAYKYVFEDRIVGNTQKQIVKKVSLYFNRSTMQALMKEADIEARVQIEKRARTDQENAIVKYGISKERILAELAKVAFAQQTDVMSWGPDGIVVKDSSEIGDAAAAVGEVTQSGGGDSPVIMKVKLLDKQQAIINLGKELYGMFQQKIEHKGQVQMAVGAKFIIERD